MLNALLQTIANLGIDPSKINATFNAIIATIAGGDLTSVNGIGDVMAGILSVFTGLSSSDIATVVSSLIQSVVEVIANDTTSTLLTTITGA